MAMELTLKFRYEKAAYNIAKATLMESGQFTDAQVEVLAVAMGRAGWAAFACFAESKMDPSQIVARYLELTPLPSDESES